MKQAPLQREMLSSLTESVGARDSAAADWAEGALPPPGSRESRDSARCSLAR